MSYQVVENRLGKELLEILDLEEKPARLVVQRKAVRPPKSQVRGDHPKVDRPCLSASSCRRRVWLNWSAGSFPQILERQRLIERLAGCPPGGPLTPFAEGR